MKKAKYKTPLYSCYITMVWMDNDKEWPSIRKQLAIEEETKDLLDSKCFEALTVIKVLKDGRMKIFVFVKECTELWDLCHESVHCASKVLLYSGVDPDFENDEPHAYLSDHIFKKIYKFQEKHKAKK